MIIGFAGKAASGKTTAARYLLNRAENKVAILPMAEVLREEVAAFLRQVGAGEPLEWLYGDQADKVRVFHIDAATARAQCPVWEGFVDLNSDIQTSDEETALTVRRILQWWGTEYRRAQDPDYWTKAWQTKLGELNLSQTHVLVDDIRFLNELNVLKDNSGFVVKIERAGFKGANDHSSENSLDHYRDWDLVIHNDGSLDEFLCQIAARIQPLLAAKPG